MQNKMIIFFNSLGSAITGILSFITGILLLCVLVFIYFIPTFAAQNKKSQAAICVLNIFLGWTFIGWVVALVWAIGAESVNPQTVSDLDTIKCPLCAEIIKREAIKCRFCGADLKTVESTPEPKLPS